MQTLWYVGVADLGMNKCAIRSEATRRCEASNGSEQKMAHAVSTTRRLDSGGGCRQWRRWYCGEVGGGGMPGMMIVEFDGGGRD